MTTNENGLTYQQTNALATLKDHAAFINGAVDSIESKAHQNFTVIYIVLAVAGAANLCSFGSPEMLKESVS